MTDKDVERELSRCKRRIRAIERLRGCKAVLDGNVLVTVYRPPAKRLKRDIRNSR
jgi:hypothetical protein